MVRPFLRFRALDLGGRRQAVRREPFHPAISFTLRHVPAGVTLVELLVALVFIAVFAAGMASLSVAVVQGNAQARATDVAVFLAHDRLEQIRSTPYGSITAASFAAEAYGTIAVGTPAVPFAAFQRAVSIEDDTPTQGMKRIVVTVSWRGGAVSEEMLVGQ